MEKGGWNCMVTHDYNPNWDYKLKWTTVSVEEVVNSNYRFEATSYNIEARQAKKDLKNCQFPLKTIGGKDGLANAYHRLRFKRVFVEKSEFPIYQPSQVLDIQPRPNQYVSHKTKTNLDALRVNKNQILLTCSGSIGKCTLVSDTLANKIFSHDLIRITAKKLEDTGYIYAYLQSKIGQLIIATNNYGAVIQHIEPEHLENIQIPNPPDKIKREIHDKVIKSFALRDESNRLIAQAEKILVDELQLPPFDEIKPEFYRQNAGVQNWVVNPNELDERFDGSYHIPIVKTLIKYIKRSGADVLALGSKELTRNIVLPGRFKRNYVEEGAGTVFLGGKQIYELDPSNKKYLSVKTHGNRIEQQLFLKENMIAITCSGTIGKVNIIPKHWENWTMSQHVLRAVPNSNDIAGYLYIWLNTKYGRTIIKRFIYGAVIDEIDNKHLANVQIPILKDKSKMQEINDLALEANRLRSEAYYLEQEAIKDIDEKVIFG